MRIQLLFSLLIPCAAYAAVQNQVVNPDFDSGTDSWLPSLAASGGGILSWDSATGNPAAGSAEVNNIFVEPAIDAWRQCVPIGAPAYSLSVNVASALKTGNHCRVQVDFVSATSCFSGAQIVHEILLPNSRNDGTFETLSAAGELPSGTHAAAVYLEHIRVDGAPAGDSVCRFDHVDLNNDTVFDTPFE